MSANRTLWFSLFMNLIQNVEECSEARVLIGQEAAALVRARLGGCCVTAAVSTVLVFGLDSDPTAEKSRFCPAALWSQGGLVWH